MYEVLWHVYQVVPGIYDITEVGYPWYCNCGYDSVFGTWYIPSNIHTTHEYYVPSTRIPNTEYGITRYKQDMPGTAVATSAVSAVGGVDALGEAKGEAKVRG